MGIGKELESALRELTATGRVEVRENGEWLAALDGMQYEIRGRSSAILLHMWSSQQTLVRRVLRLAKQSRGSVVVEVARFDGRPARLEFVAVVAAPPARRLLREQFRARLRQLLSDRFPDETLDSLTNAPDLQHSLSGSYTRGVMHAGADGRAVLAAAPDEDGATVDGILTFGLIWLHRVRERARRKRIQGLRIFLPRSSSTITAHRLGALAFPQEVDLYEYDPLYWRLQRVPISDAGNLETWLVQRREVDAAIATAMPEAERIQALCPEAIRLGFSPGTREATLRFRGLEFARQKLNSIWFGLGDRQQILTPETWPSLEALVRQLEIFRHPLASNSRHRLYRLQPERWLEALVAVDPGRVDARLDPRHIYSQVPAFSAIDRGIIDLLGVTHEGRLAILELKAAEDIQLVLQAADYWLRVRWHHSQDDFRRYGYFPGVELQAKPPLLILVSPGFQFHPASDMVLSCLSREIEVMRVGLAENWRRNLRVVFRQ